MAPNADRHRAVAPCTTGDRDGRPPAGAAESAGPLSPLAHIYLRAICEVATIGIVRARIARGTATNTVRTDNGILRIAIQPRIRRGRFHLSLRGRLYGGGSLFEVRKAICKCSV